MKRGFIRRWNDSLLFGMSLILIGCIQFPKGNEVISDEKNQCEPQMLANSLEPASFTIAFERLGVGQSFVIEKEQMMIRNLLLCTGFFKDMTLGKSLQNYHLEVNIQNSPLTPPRYGRYAWLSLMTATIIPGFDEERYSLVLNVYYNGIYKGQVEAEQVMEVWYWLPFLLITPIQQETTRRQIIRNLLVQAGIKLKQSEIIKANAELPSK